MSRGPGHVMRGIERALPSYGALRGLSDQTLARRIYGPDPTPRQLESIAQAARRLIAQGIADSAFTNDGLKVYFRAEGQSEPTPDEPNDIDPEAIPIAVRYLRDHQRRAGTSAAGRAPKSRNHRLQAAVSDAATSTDALARLEALARDEPTNPRYQRDLAKTYDCLADRARESGQSTEAQRLYRQALALREALARDKPTNTTYERDLAIAYERLGDVARELGQLTEAERLYRRSLPLREGRARDKPANMTYQRELAIAYERLGDLARESGQGPEAERMYRRSLILIEALVLGEPTNTIYQDDLAISRSKLGDLDLETDAP